MSLSAKKINIGGKDVEIEWEIIKDMERVNSAGRTGKAHTVRIKNYYDGLKKYGKTKSYTDTE